MKKLPDSPVPTTGAGPVIVPVLLVTSMTLPEAEPLLGLLAVIELYVTDSPDDMKREPDLPVATPAKLLVVKISPVVKDPRVAIPTDPPNPLIAVA